jgi:hypothetical protein
MLKQCLERLQLPQGYDFASICNRTGRIPPMFLRSRAFPPGFIAPCLPTIAPQPPSGPMWLHELKHDGFRVIARKEGKQVKLYSRPGNVTYSVFWIPSDCSSQCNKLNMYVLFREISWISSRGMRPCL